MTEFFKFATSDFWVFIGVVLIIQAIGEAVAAVIKSLRRNSRY